MTFLRPLGVACLMVALLGAGPAQRWEYAYLKISSRGYAFSTPSGVVSGKTEREIVAKMGSTVVGEDEELAIWQAAGQQGWELCFPVQNRDYTMYYFKRPVVDKAPSR